MPPEISPNLWFFAMTLWGIVVKIRFFNKQQFYKQREAEIGKTISKS